MKEKIAAIQVIDSPDEGGFYGYAFRKDGTDIENTTTPILKTSTEALIEARKLAQKAGYNKFFCMPFH